MKKIIILMAITFPLAFTTAFASGQADMNNLAGSAVKVIKKYPGEWRGWSDGCVNCDKPLATQKPKKQPVTNSKPASKANKTSLAEKLDQAKKARAQSSRNYCACNCKTGELSAEPVNKSLLDNSVEQPDSLNSNGDSKDSLSEQDGVNKREDET